MRGEDRRKSIETKTRLAQQKESAMCNVHLSEGLSLKWKDKFTYLISSCCIQLSLPLPSVLSRLFQTLLDLAQRSICHWLSVFM